MVIDWDMGSINGMAADWTNESATWLGSVAQKNMGGDMPIEVSFATPEEMLATIGAGPESLVREYGTAEEDPSPWGLVSLMEASE